MDKHVYIIIYVYVQMYVHGNVGTKRVYTEPLNPFGQYTYVIGHMKQTIVITLYAVEQ